MPRGVAKPLEERLASIDQEITEMMDRRDNINAKIKDLEAKKQSLLDEKRHDQLSHLAEMLESKGISPEEAIAKLSGESV